MALVVSNASRLKPEIRLAQAVSQYEADLSNEQKTVFRTYKSQSHSNPPDTSDVMRLTADIDRRASGKVGGKCYGPRFTNFLQAVQQFAALGDVVIGGSQNIVACSVWALVRMSLLSVVNFSSYLDKLSSLLMTAGRLSPRYQTMALLYPRSKNIQSYLSEYFIIVVRLCHRLLKFTQKSTLGQLASTLSDSDVKSFQSDLDSWGNLIKDEVSLHMAKRLEDEARESSAHRALAAKLSHNTSIQQRMKRHARILELCSIYDHEMAWKQTRKLGNTRLFASIPEYNAWKGREVSGTLLFTGKLGSGKSVLLANIVDDLILNTDKKAFPVTYFFCRHDILESLKPRTVIGSLARQLLRDFPDIAMSTELPIGTSKTLDFEAIFKLLQHAMSPTSKAYVVLDGLDELERPEREVLIQQLHRLQSHLNLLLCTSLRIGPETVLDPYSEQFMNVSISSLPEDNPDIRTYVNTELENRLQSRKLVLGDPNLILDIQDALLEGSQGMFLWVNLQIQSLCTMKTDDAIRHALAKLPKNLSETFSRILKKAGEEAGVTHQQQILEFVTVAQRPLTIEELREALGVVPGNTTWNPETLPNDMYATLACCGCLLAVDEEDLTIRLVHQSIKQFLLSELPPRPDVAFAMNDANTRMLLTLLTYTSYGVFDTQLTTTASPQLRTGAAQTTESAPAVIIRSALDCSGSVASAALSLLQSRKTPNINMIQTLAEAKKHPHPQPPRQFHLYSYAESYWSQHALSHSVSGDSTIRTLQRLLRRTKLKITWKDQEGRPLMCLAAREGNAALLMSLVDATFKHGYTILDFRDNDDREALSYAAENGHVSIIEILLTSGLRNLGKRDKKGRSPVSYAAENGHGDVINMLVATEFKDEMDMIGRTALSYAAENGHESVVEFLLASAPFVTELHFRKPVIHYITMLDTRGRGAISYAAEKGHVSVVGNLLRVLDEHRKLLSAKRQADSPLAARTPLAMPPLCWAAKFGHNSVVELLLDFDKDQVNLEDERGRIALWHAIEYRHHVVAERLRACLRSYGPQTSKPANDTSIMAQGRGNGNRKNEVFNIAEWDNAYDVLWQCCLCGRDHIKSKHNYSTCPRCGEPECERCETYIRKGSRAVAL